MRRCLKHVGPHIVEQVVQRVFTAEAVDAERHVLHHSASSLSVDQISAGQGHNQHLMTPVRSQ